MNDDIKHLETLIDKGECQWIEFKENQNKGKVIGKICSALANGACVNEEPHGYILWGVSDEGQIVGTRFDFSKEKVGNQALEMWLTTQIHPSPNLEFKLIDHPKGRVVMLKVPASKAEPTLFENIPYGRIGASVTSLIRKTNEYLELLKAVTLAPWETSVARSFSSSYEALKLLSVDTYFRLQGGEKPANDDVIIDIFRGDGLLAEHEGRWGVTNLGAILLAKNLADFGVSLAVKGVRLTFYPGDTRDASLLISFEGKKGYAVGFQSLIEP